MLFQKNGQSTPNDIGSIKQILYKDVQACEDPPEDDSGQSRLQKSQVYHVTP